MTLKEMLEYCEAVALASKLAPTEDAVWRGICRSYSKKFSTPLHEVINLDPEFVVTHYYEDQFDDIEEEEHIEKLYDMILTLEDPEYERQKKEELDDFIEQVEAEEEERIKHGRPIHPALKHESDIKNTPEKQELTPPNQPTGGHINLSYLEKEESENQFEE